jgi:hypothetical protein
MGIHIKVIKMVEIICPSCNGNPFGRIKFWPNWTFACGTCEGSGKINIGLKAYIRYIFTNKVAASEVVKAMDHPIVGRKIP